MFAGFLLILEPFETDNATVPNPIFHFTYAIINGSVDKQLTHV
jgi:hypothetical protein